MKVRGNMLKGTPINWIAVILAVLLTLTVGMTGCGGSNNENQDLDKPAYTEEGRRIARIQKEKEETRKDRIKAPKGGWIKSVKLKPEKHEGGTAIKIEAETTQPLDTEKNERLTYIFWRNNNKTVEKDENLIPATFYKRGDLISAEVVFYRDDRILEKKRSEPLFVENTSPVIRNVEMPKVDGPGTYTYKVIANDVDGDTLTYTIAPATEDQPLPKGFTIDSHTGVITFVLAEDQKIPPALKFIVSANDGGGGIARKAVTINFTSETIIKKEKKEGEEGEPEKEEEKEDKTDENGLLPGLKPGNRKR